MTAAGEPAGFLMHGSWHPDLVLSDKLELAGGRHAPGHARRWIASVLGGSVAEDDLIDVVVLTSELVTNAVSHGGAGERETIVVHVAVAADVLRIEVCDRGAGFERPAVARPHAGGGNGLVLVERLSSCWGISDDDGTCVWFERELAPI